MFMVTFRPFINSLVYPQNAAAIKILSQNTIGDKTKKGLLRNWERILSQNSIEDQKKGVLRYLVSTRSPYNLSTRCNVPLEKSKCARGVHVLQSGNP